MNPSETSESKSLIVDVDTGVDDALALTMILGLKHSVKAITVAAGNTDMEKAYDNTLRTLKVLNKTNIPVYKGAIRPIDGRWDHEEQYFGRDNFGGMAMNYSIGTNPAEANMTYAPMKMIELIKNNSKKLTLLLLAPLTNIAIAMLAEPNLTDHVKEIFILGGTIEGRGRIYPGSEFNFLSDPDAAQIVLQRATCNVTVMPWEAVLTTTVPWEIFDAVANQTGNKAKFLRDITNHTIHCCLQRERSSGFRLGDVLVALAALVPGSVSKTLQHRVDVEKCGTYTMGMLVHGWRPHMIRDVNRTVNIVVSFNKTIVIEYFNKTFGNPESLAEALAA